MTGPRFEQTDFELQVGGFLSGRRVHTRSCGNGRRRRRQLTISEPITAQPRPYSAIELIHKQPVRWTHDRIVACDGGGGPEGHPKIYVNTDKPEIATCNYCGLPFVGSALPVVKAG